MTIAEAIKRIKESRDYRYTHYGFTNLDGEALDMAISALEKQIPKKIIYDEYGRDEGYPHCPNCNETLINDFVGVKYCPECGQRIDWKGV